MHTKVQHYKVHNTCSGKENYLIDRYMLVHHWWSRRGGAGRPGKALTVECVKEISNCLQEKEECQLTQNQKNESTKKRV